MPAGNQRFLMLCGPRDGPAWGLWSLWHGRQDLLDEGALGLGVAGTVVAQPSGQGALEVAVGPGNIRVRTEDVAKGEMAVERGSAHGAHVQVVGRGAGGGW